MQYISNNLRKSKLYLVASCVHSGRFQFHSNISIVLRKSILYPLKLPWLMWKQSPHILQHSLSSKWSIYSVLLFMSCQPMVISSFIQIKKKISWHTFGKICWFVMEHLLTLLANNASTVHWLAVSILCSHVMKLFMAIFSNSTEDVIWSQRILGRWKIIFIKDISYQY
jgi:hypothetical protein